MRTQVWRISTMVWALATASAGCGGEPGGAAADAASPDAANVDAAVDAAPPIDAAPPVRHLGIEVNPVDDATQLAVIDAVVAPLGVDTIQLTLPWSWLEPTAGAADYDLLAYGLGAYAERGLSVLLSIPIVDTVSTFVPADLDGVALDDPALIARAEAMIAEVLARAGDELAYLVLSNEVNINLDNIADPTVRAATWAALETLTDALAAKVEALAPAVKTGISVTSGALDPDSGRYSAAAAAAVDDDEVAFVTYYRGGNFGGGSGDDLADDLDDLLAAVTPPLVFKEFGYATGPALGGSEAGQAAFFAEAFAAWDARAAGIELVNVSRMFDGERAACEAQAADYGLPGDEPFIQFLCTLGLRSADDVAKPAWATFAAAAAARHWGP
ncbi:MAG: hypothetical protein R2939_02025 [Kofleriaceae bacterium]